MTTIAAISIDGVAAIAVDSLLTSGNDVPLYCQKKLCKLAWGKVVAGVAGGSLAGNLLERLGNFGSNLEGRELILELYNKWDAAASAAGWDKAADGSDTPYRSMRMIAVTEGVVYSIFGDGSVDEVPSGTPIAIGSGERYAYGAMHAAMSFTEEPVTVVRSGIESATRYDLYTGGPMSWSFWSEAEGKWMLNHGGGLAQ